MAGHDCRATCVCRAVSGDDALRRAVTMVGDSADAVVAILAAHGWTLTRAGGAR